MQSGTLDAPKLTQKKLGSRALTIAICAFGLATLVSFFRWTLVGYLSPFLEMPLEIGIAGFFFVSIIWSMIHIFRSRGTVIAKLMPLAANLATVIAVLFVPFTSITINLDFRAHLNARMSVATDVLKGKYDGQLQNAGVRGDLVALPPRLSYLSSGGQVARLRRQNDTLILFFDYRGILDSFSGFVYSSDNAPPQPSNFGGNFFEIEPLGGNWFWVSSRN